MSHSPNLNNRCDAACIADDVVIEHTAEYPDRPYMNGSHSNESHRFEYTSSMQFSHYLMGANPSASHFSWISFESVLFLGAAWFFVMMAIGAGVTNMVKV